MRSIRDTLRTGLVAATITAFAAAGIATEQGARRTLLNDVDRSLHERALWVSSTVELTDEGLELGFRDFPLEDFAPHTGASLLELWQAGGDTLYRSPSLEGVHLQRPKERLGPAAMAFERTPDGRRVRVVRMRFQAGVDPDLQSPPPAPFVLLSLGRDMAGVDALLGRLRLLLIAVGIAATLLMLAFARFVVRSSLRPLERVAGEIGALDSVTLSHRLETSELPSELEPVVRRLNELLARVEGAFARERTFSADIAHELRTPLAGMRTSLEVELAHPRDVESHRGTLRDSLAIAIRMQGLVETLLQLSRFDAGLVAAEPAPVDLADLARSTLRSLEPQANARGLSFRAALDRPAPVETDAALLSAALRNVLDNAVSHSEERGEVHVEVAPHGDAARLTVANAANGVTASEVPRLFERFVRGDSARTAGGGHFGLGLALTRRIADALGAHLEIRIDGGEFILTLDVPNLRPRS